MAHRVAARGLRDETPEKRVEASLPAIGKG
jgi:hypothetical protein